jgi:hypothetical protein
VRLADVECMEIRVGYLYLETHRSICGGPGS